MPSNAHKWQEENSPQSIPFPDPSTGVKVASRPKTKKPPMYKVILLNDDFTPMDFVVNILQTIFYLSHSSATKIMMEVHHQGAGVAGIFTHEIAEAKICLVQKKAKTRKYPLRCIMEKVSS